MKQPANEVFLAAELASIGILPGRAAIYAHELCAMGRRYFRMFERLCGGEEEWGRNPEAQRRIEACEKRRSNLYIRICDRVNVLRGFCVGRDMVELDQDGGGLGLVLHTESGQNGLHNTTSLR